MNKRNFQKELEHIIEGIDLKKRPSLFLHACCAPCSSYVLEYLNKYFDITVFYYNPNINSSEEFLFRQSEVERLISQMPLENPVKLIKTEFSSGDFYSAVKGFEDCKEGGERCFRCYELRLRKTAELCKELGFDYFATTLTISRQKSSERINEIGERVSLETGAKYLISDFKKKHGNERSIQLSAEYNLYRQNFCGCAYSYAESLKR